MQVARVITDTDDSGNRWVWVMNRVGQHFKVHHRNKEYTALITSQGLLIAVPNECVELISEEVAA